MTRIMPLSIISTIATLLFLGPAGVAAQEPALLVLNMGEAAGTRQVSTILQIMMLLTVLSVAPAILLMTTSFIRIVVVLSLLRQAMGTQQMPPNQIIIGLAMFLTFFIMSPVMTQINDNALQPYLNEELGEDAALSAAIDPIRVFMFSHVRENDLALMSEFSGNPSPESLDDIPTLTLIPAFMLSELKRAFTIGFMIFVPFLVIDMITASVLMTMGMLMLPPIIISLPFKVLLFVLVDGWHLVVGSLMQGFF